MENVRGGGEASAAGWWPESPDPVTESSRGDRPVWNGCFCTLERTARLQLEVPVWGCLLVLKRKEIQCFTEKLLKASHSSSGEMQFLSCVVISLCRLRGPAEAGVFH